MKTTDSACALIEMNADHATHKRSVREVASLLPVVWSVMKPSRGMLAVGFVLMVINRLSGMVLPYSTKYLVDDILVKHRVDLIWPLAGVLLVATALQGATTFALTQTLSKAAQRLIADLREKVQEHVGRLPVAYYDANKAGALVSRIMSDVEGVRNLIGTGLVELVGGLLTALFALIVLVTISPLMTGLAAIFLVIFGLGLRRAFNVIRPIFRERAQITAEVSGRLTESVGGVRVVKGYHAEAREHQEFSRGVRRLLTNILRTLTVTAYMNVSTAALTGIVGVTVILVGSHEVLTNAMTLGGLVTYTMFLGYVVAPLFQSVGIGVQLTEAIAGLDRTRDLLAERPEDDDPRRTKVLGEIDGDIAFEQVRFAYEPGREVLHDVSFHAAPGTVTALVGSSGAGKSTMIGLIAAFQAPQGGGVLVDGMDLSTVKLDSYRTKLGVVFQDSFLFDGTIRDNVAFSQPGASEEQILRACRLAHVDEFAERFPEKYNTLIGERGVKLSGGQRQRVSIARAVLADPRILILDEATSSLDSQSEALIQEGLAYLMAGRTTFVIAHRLSTIRRADQILVVEAGRIVERGTHDSLYAAGGRYYELYTKQHGVEQDLFLAPGEGSGAAVESCCGGPDSSCCAPQNAEPDVLQVLRSSST